MKMAEDTALSGNPCASYIRCSLGSPCLPIPTDRSLDGILPASLGGTPEHRPTETPRPSLDDDSLRRQLSSLKR